MIAHIFNSVESPDRALVVYKKAANSNRGKNKYIPTT